MTAVVDPGLADAVAAVGTFDANACMNCGVCTAVCPMGLDVLPRQLFRQVLLGMTDHVLAQQETIYSCLLCRQCEERCPAGVHITANVRALRHYCNQELFGL